MMKKGRALRTIASSVREKIPCSSCTTFNILAPIYKRLNQDDSCRESDCRGFWLTRNRKILDWLLEERSSIICLQEFWVGNEELVRMYEKRLGDAGYLTFQLARTNNRGDGLLTAVRKDYFRVVNHRNLLFNDCGDRVAQLLHVELNAPFSQSGNNKTHQDILIVNTHLLFPHNPSLSLVRLQQVYKILQHVETYQKESNLSPMPVILCGDWNGSKRGHIYRFLRSQGFVSSYDTAHQYTDADAHKWVSHRNHRGNICGVDFIWLLNPNSYSKLLKTSWSEAVFSMFKADESSEYVTFAGFCEALRQLNLTGHCYGLGTQEVKDLWDQADVDGNGLLDFEEFMVRVWSVSCLDQNTDDFQTDSQEEETIGFNVKKAVLFPSEVENGTWPENYSLSDHARLTVEFSPVRVPCYQNPEYINGPEFCIPTHSDNIRHLQSHSTVSIQ